MMGVAPALSLDPVATPRTPLIGRMVEQPAVHRLVIDEAIPLITLTGPGGVGKTRLALQVARDAEPSFRDGVAFVPLASVADPPYVPLAVASVLGLTQYGDQRITEILVAALRDRHLLLVLDNVEHLLPATVFLADLLASCPNLTILATSRRALDVSGEQRFPVPTLPVPTVMTTVTAAHANQFDAVRLFVARAQAVRPSFALTDTNAEIIADICRRLDGLPLAIELAAARIAVLSPASLWGRLERRLPLLKGGPRDAPPRLQTMRAAIAWSYDLLTSQEQALFRALAIFTSGFTLEGAEAIAGAAEMQPGDVLDHVAALVSASLIQSLDGADDWLRYQTLETVREFGLEQLGAAGEEPMLRDAHLAWVLALVEAAGAVSEGPVVATRLDQIAREHPNVRAALSWALARGNAEAALRISGALLDFWFLRGHVDEGHRWLTASLAVAGQDMPSLRARGLLGVGQLASRLGDAESAVAALEESLMLYRDLDDRYGTGRVLTVLGRVHEDEGDYVTAEQLLTEAHACFEDLGDVHCRSQTLYHLGIVAQGQGDLDLAMARYAAAQEPARATDDHFNLATTLWYQALIHCTRREFARAADDIDEALRMERALGNLEAAAPSFVAVPVLAVAVGLPDAAVRTAGSATGVLSRQGLRLGLPEVLDFEHALAHAQDQLGDAAFTTNWIIGHSRTIAESAADIDAILAAARMLDTERPRPLDEHKLTVREGDVLRLVARGSSNQEIAAALFISVSTVKSHLNHVLAKLDLPSRTAAAAYAHTHGLA